MKLKLLHQGKVRDIYEIDSEQILIVTTDRISAFDVVFNETIPGKGKILTNISNFWMRKFNGLIRNHLLFADHDFIKQFADNKTEAEWLEGRSVVVQRLEPIQFEAVVRGYLIGSAWKDYKITNSIGGHQLCQELEIAQRLPTLLYTPTTKAPAGDHDVNITYEETERIIAPNIANRIKTVSLILYSEAAKYAKEHGFIIADTKFEYGLDPDGMLVLMDEVLTPDSSRYWNMNDYRQGVNPPSFDKQIIRDYLETLNWDKTPPPPELPEFILKKTEQRYKELEIRLVHK